MKKDIRCAFISSYMGPYPGNYVPSVIACEKRMQKNGWHSVYVFPKDVENYDWVDMLHEVTDKVYFIDYAPKSRSNVLALRKIFKEEKINLIHSRMCGWDFTARAAAPSIPIIWHMEMGVNLERKSKYIKNLLKFKVLAAGKVYHSAASAAVAEKINSLKPRHACEAIPNSLDLSRLRPMSTAPSDAQIKNLLVFAYEPHVKGLDVALDALENLNASKVKYRLLISAQDGTYKYLDERYSALPEWITILKPTNDIASVYEQCDIMLLPSRSEGFSYALTEALYTGLPAVCSEITGNQWAKEMKSVFFFESENAADLGKTIEECAASPVSEENREYNRGVIRQKYSMDTWADHMIKFIDSIPV